MYILLGFSKKTSRTPGKNLRLNLLFIIINIMAGSSNDQQSSPGNDERNPEDASSGKTSSSYASPEQARTAPSSGQHRPSMGCTRQRHPTDNRPWAALRPREPPSNSSGFHWWEKVLQAEEVSTILSRSTVVGNVKYEKASLSWLPKFATLWAQQPDLNPEDQRLIQDIYQAVRGLNDTNFDIPAPSTYEWTTENAHTVVAHGSTCASELETVRPPQKQADEAGIEQENQERSRLMPASEKESEAEKDKSGNREESGAADSAEVELTQKKADMKADIGQEKQENPRLISAFEKESEIGEEGWEIGQEFSTNIGPEVELAEKKAVEAEMEQAEDGIPRLILASGEEPEAEQEEGETGQDLGTANKLEVESTKNNADEKADNIEQEKRENPRLMLASGKEPKAGEKGQGEVHQPFIKEEEMKAEPRRRKARRRRKRHTTEMEPSGQYLGTASGLEVESTQKRVDEKADIDQKKQASPRSTLASGKESKAGEEGQGEEQQPPMKEEEPSHSNRETSVSIFLIACREIEFDDETVAASWRRCRIIT